MKKALLLILFFFTANSFSIDKKEIKFTFNSNKKMEVGEELKYVVSYSLMKIGEVKIKVKSRKEVKGGYQYSTVAYIDSYSGIPFVDLHQIYESKVNSNYFSDYFKGLVKYDEYTTFTEYDFDYQNKSAEIKKGKVYPKEIWTDSSAVFEKEFQDGLSILFYARMNTGVDKTVNVPCFVNEKKVSAKINFYSENMPVEIDNVDYKIDCVRLDGETDFISVFGLTGYFEGWFSNDEAAVPILAKMKVIIGNVKLELVEWKKKGWNPPKYIQ